MPLFRRPDGELVTNIGSVRRLMPLLMPRRNESLIYHTTEWEIDNARNWLGDYNQGREKSQRASLFFLVIYLIARMLHQRPGINRFVAGSRVYQRKDVFISFAAKKEMTDEAPLVTIKLRFPEGESFDDCVQRILAAVNEGRAGRKNRVDGEVRLLAKLPVPLLRLVFWAGRWLDRVNLLPASMIDPDPMYTSFFLANLGSVQMDGAYHHLYEYGTCSLFGVVGAVKQVVKVDRICQPVVRDVLPGNWTFDERVNDGFYVAGCLAIIRQMMEDPGQYINLAAADSADTVDAAQGVGA